MASGSRHGAQWRSAPLLRRVGIVTLGALAASLTTLAGSTPAQATVTSDSAAAAQLAAAAGYRTGIAVLDWQTGSYYGAGEDTGSFASESVAKMFIATELLLTGKMTGDTESMAYQMITQSDDDDADDLYGLAGGDDVINLVAAHYNIPSLGQAPEQSGWWGNTEINAKALVYFYAAIAADPVVGPWLMNAMANATEYGADGTYQFFGIPSATTGAAIKQGWGDDGDDSPNAVFNSTGFVGSGRYAVAILTDGPSDTYGSAISAMVTAEAKALMPGGKLDDPVAHNPVISDLSVQTVGSTVQITGTATDPDTSGPIAVHAVEGAATVAAGTTADDHNFELTFLATNGAHSYAVTAANVGEGTADATASAAAVTVDGSPQGYIQVVSGRPGQLVIAGEEVDPNLTDGEAPELTVSVDGRPLVSEAVQESADDDYRLVLPLAAGHYTVMVVYTGTDGAPSIIEGIWPVTVAETAAQQRDAELERLLPYSVGLLVLLGTGAAVLWRRRSHRRRA